MSTTIDRLRAWGLAVQTRAEWGAKYGAVYAERLRTRPVDFPVSFAFAHITVTKANGAEGARLVERIGFDRFGSGISYNWLVDHETHAVFEGMPLAAKGTHTVNDKRIAGYPLNLNYQGHAVAFMAMPGDVFCDECAEMFACVVAAEQLDGVMRRGAEIAPHSKFASKDCPTAAVRDRLPDITARVADIVAHGNPNRVTRITKARALLKKAKKRAVDKGRTKRAENIDVALKTLPKE